MKHLVFTMTCLSVLLAVGSPASLVLVAACGGREMVADCGPVEGPGSTYCHWDESVAIPAGFNHDTCCPPQAPYCGEPGMTCPAGYCCTFQPVPGAPIGGPESLDGGSE